MNRIMIRLSVAVLIVIASLAAHPVLAANTCDFTDDTGSKTLYLEGDCTTDATIFIPDGYTLDGQGYTITANDPAGGHFTGAVVQNAGSTANIINLTITASGLANACDGGANRLRGIMFEGASGSITHVNVYDINQGNSGCQEGNAIEIRNEPFDGTHPNTVQVSVTNSTIDDYQKTGIVANGDVSVAITNNTIGSADLDMYIAANSVQFGYGATGSINNNTITGNDWDGNASWAATAVLIYMAGDVNINHNEITGEGTDIGIYALDSGTVNVMNNTISRTPDDGLDVYGIGVYFDGNFGKSKLVHNTLTGWLVAYEGADLDRVNTVEP